MIRLSGRVLLLIPPFSGSVSLLQVFIPILSQGGSASRYGVAFFCILCLKLLCSFLPWFIRVQAQDNPFQVRILSQIGVQWALVQAAQSHGIACDRPVQGAEAHQVDGGFESLLLRQRNPPYS